MNRRNRRERRGQSLMLMFLVILALVGVLALTFDFGFVVLSRRMMQTAVNTGALEGARDRAGLGREDARNVIRNVFDDDLDPTANTTSLGAGPDQSLVQRDALQRPRFGDGSRVEEWFPERHQFIYRPDPQLNDANELHGDFVRGYYCDESTSSKVNDGESNDDVCEPCRDELTSPPVNHRESNDYVRDDFDRDDCDDCDDSEPQEPNAFLARIRRTPQRDGIANPLDRIAGVSSSGSGSPLMIGHLMPIRPNSADSYDIRRDGVAIRATAIAVTQPIVYVGKATGDDFLQLLDYAYYVECPKWVLLDNPQHRLGASMPPPDDPTHQNASAPTTPGYAAIVGNITGECGGSQVQKEYYVIGFCQRLESRQFRANASPRLQDAWPELGKLSPATRSAILKRNRNLDLLGTFESAGQPALVRSLH
ncbi:Tad domain-containing protein [Rosistilla oblonga]|uniref:Tad domain-containing protein n=1 Tax=Rosistilla oblonga TaxID=2527990 RepID=UPI003A97BB27